MSLADRLSENYPATPASRRERPSIDFAKGEATFDAQPGESMDAALSRLVKTMWPDADDRTLEILDVQEVTFWGDPDNPSQRFKAKIRQPVSGSRDDGDFAALLKLASRAKPLVRKSHDTVSDPQTFVVCIADWQAGQLRGGGPEGLVERVHGMRSAMQDRVRTLVREGTNIERVALLCLGDLVEACDGHYAMQNANTIDAREQTKLVRRLLYGIVDTAAKLAPAVTLAAVPGNHGEKRKDGKAYTTWSDNLDVEIPEQVGDILSANDDRFGHVAVQLPTGSDLTLTLDLSGTRVGMAHGHQFKGGGSIQQKVDRWWSHKAKHRHLIGDADVLCSGHYHHLNVWEEGTHDGGTRAWFQCPSLDGGSDWFEHQGGAPTRRGTLTFVTSGGTWDRLEVLR